MLLLRRQEGDNNEYLSENLDDFRNGYGVVFNHNDRRFRYWKHRSSGARKNGYDSAYGDLCYSVLWIG